MTWQRRTIAVGIGDQGAMHLLDWVAVLARSGDLVHLVHAHDCLPRAAVDWQLPVENDDVLYAASARHAAYAASALRKKRPDLAVDDDILRCPSARALPAAASDADLIVIGSPHQPGNRSALCRLARDSPCPVLVIGDQSPPAIPEREPVMVLLRDLSNDEAAIEAAFEAAVERRGGLIALRAWHPRSGADLAGAEAEEQLALDLFVAGWTPRFPSVGVSIQLRIGDASSILRQYAADTPLLIVGNGLAADAPESALDPVIDTALRVRHAPTLLIPSSCSQSPLTDARPDQLKQSVS